MTDKDRIAALEKQIAELKREQRRRDPLACTYVGSYQYAADQWPNISRFNARIGPYPPPPEGDRPVEDWFPSLITDHD